MRSKSIVLISNNYWTLFKFRYEIIQHLTEKGFNIHLVAENDGYEKKFIKNNAIICHNINFSGRSINPFNEIKTFLLIKKILKEIRPIFLFSYTIKPNIYSGYLCGKLRINHIPMVTGLGYFFNNLTWPLKVIVHYIIKKSFERSNEVWFTNLSDKKYYIDNNIITNTKKTSIVMGAGIDLNVIPFTTINKDNKKKFIMIARLLYEKGTHEFIQAAKYFSKWNMYKFILVGDHQMNKYYVKKSIIDSLVQDNILEYSEFTDDIDRYYSEASCIVLPSYREGLSTILLEAAARKIPIITTDVPGCRDIIKDGSYGFLCKPKSSQSLIDAIKRFLDTSDSDLCIKSDKTYQYIKDNCSKDNIINKYDKIIDVYKLL